MNVWRQTVCGHSVGASILQHVGPAAGRKSSKVGPQTIWVN